MFKYPFLESNLKLRDQMFDPSRVIFYPYFTRHSINSNRETISESSDCQNFVYDNFVRHAKIMLILK
jgi:hypothetical protein